MGAERQHEVSVGMSVFWVTTWPKTVKGQKGHAYRSRDARVGGWTPGARGEALTAAKAALAASLTNGAIVHKAVPRPMGEVTNHVYVRIGGAFDGEEWSVHGTEAEADATAQAYVADLKIMGVHDVGLKKLGTRSSGVLTPCVHVNDLPWWAVAQLAAVRSA